MKKKETIIELDMLKHNTCRMYAPWLSPNVALPQKRQATRSGNMERWLAEYRSRGLSQDNDAATPAYAH